MGKTFEGGHEYLPSGTAYTMFDEGAYGGITHSLHGPNLDEHTNIFGGFIDDSYTMVLRPLFKQVVDTKILPKKTEYENWVYNSVSHDPFAPE